MLVWSVYDIDHTAKTASKFAAAEPGDVSYTIDLTFDPDLTLSADLSTVPVDVVFGDEGPRG